MTLPLPLFRTPAVMVWSLAVAFALVGSLPRAYGQPEPEATPLLKAEVEIVSASMISRSVFRVRARHSAPLSAPLTIVVPFPGMPAGASLTQPAAPNNPVAFNFNLNTLQVPRFRKTLRLRVTAALGGAVPATSSREAVVPLPVVTVLGIDPGAAFLGRPSVYRAEALEEALVRQSAAAWGAESGYQVYGLFPGIRDGSPADEERLAGEPAPAPMISLERYITIFPFRWDANTGTLAAETDDLERFIRLTVIANTWADQVILLCHSRGANLARMYLTRYAAADGSHPQCAAAVLACMPATGSPWAMFWRKFGVAKARGFPKGWYDTLPTYPWYRDHRESPATPLPFGMPKREDRVFENRVLKELNARTRPAGVELQIIYGRTAERDTLVAFTNKRVKVGSLLRGLVGAGKGEADPSEFGPLEYGDFIVSAYSARGIQLSINPAKDEVQGGEVVPWLRDVPTREFVFERPFKEVGGMHVGFLAEPEVQSYLFDWLNHHQVQEVAPITSAVPAPEPPTPPVLPDPAPVGEK